MGKLSRIRRAVRRNPDRFGRRNGWIQGAFAKKGFPIRTLWLGSHAPYVKVIKKVLNQLGRDRSSR